MQSIKVGALEVLIEKNKRSRHLKLRFNKEGVPSVTIPWWVSYRVGAQFARENEEWILKNQKKYQAPKRFKDGEVITVLGKTLIIIHQPQARRGVWIEGENLFVSGPLEHLHRRVRDFIKQKAYAVIQEKSLILAAQIGKRPTRITLRDTSSRWGSCSMQGHLNFCWKLALAPDYVLEYIIAHEVAHLQEMNHSSAFWKIVTTLTMHQADAHIWLKKNGSSLQAWE